MIAEFSAIAAAFLWSFSNILIKSASRRASALALNALSASSGSVFVLITLIVTDKAGELSRIPLSAAVYLVSAILLGMGIGDTLYIRSMALIGVSRASPISGVAPLFALPIAIVFLEEHLTWLNVGGVLLVVVGVYLVARTAEANDLTVAQKEKFRYEGVLFALVASLCWALSSAITKLALLEMDVVVANAIGVPVTASVLLMIAARYRGGMSLRAVGWRPLILACSAGTLSMGVGMLLYLSAIQGAGVAKTTTLSTISPIFAVFLSVIFLKEKLSSLLVLGTILSILGVWLLL